MRPTAHIKATDGNFYGTTTNGGTFALGTVYRITPSGTVTVLHNFAGGATDGDAPEAGLIQGSDGNFYGTTDYGGNISNRCSRGCGTVFKVTPAGGLTLLHAFTGSEGEHPNAALIQASDGNLYGTTSQGGASQVGTIFRVTPSGAFTMLHEFSGGSTDGASPQTGVIQASDGNFYGTTRRGGNEVGNLGTIFKMTSDGVVSVLAHSLPLRCFSIRALSFNPPAGISTGPRTWEVCNDQGTAYRMTPTGEVTIIHDFLPPLNRAVHSGLSFRPLMETSMARHTSVGHQTLGHQTLGRCSG